MQKNGKRNVPTTMQKNGTRSVPTTMQKNGTWNGPTTMQKNGTRSVPTTMQKNVSQPDMSRRHTDSYDIHATLKVSPLFSPECLPC